MRNREEELFERLKKVKFNPYTLKKTGHIFSEFIKFIGKYSRLQTVKKIITNSDGQA